MIPADRDALDVLAGEYVLGTLDSDSTAEVDRALTANKALRDAVAFWQDRLHPLSVLSVPAEPNPASWRAIEQRIAPTQELARGNVWRSLTLWRGIAAATILVAVCLALYIGTTRPPSNRPYVAMLRASQQSQIAWIAIMGSNGLSLRAATVANPPPGRAYQLWAITPGSSSPEPLGIITLDGRLVLHTLPPGLGTGATLAISIEPPGGSPTGRPTGPVVFTGKIEPALSSQGTTPFKARFPGTSSSEA
jgi:anti-sigma-K factor RskA